MVLCKLGDVKRSEVAYTIPCKLLSLGTFYQNQQEVRDVSSFRTVWSNEFFP